MKKTVKKYFLIIALLSVAVITVLSFLLYHAYSDAIILVEKQFNEQQMLVARQTALRMEGNIRLLARELELLSETPDIKNFNLPEARKILNRTFDYVKRFFVNDIGLIDSDGIVRLPLNAPQLTGKDFSFRTYFKEAQKLGTSVPTYEFITFRGVEKGMKGIVVAMPIFNENSEFGGVILFTLKVNELIRGFIPSQGAGSEFWVIDSGGHTLFHPRYKPGTVIYDLPDMDISFRDFLENIKSGTQCMLECISPEGRNMIIASYPLIIADQTWSIVVAAPETIVSGLLVHFNLRYTVGAMLALLAIIGGSFITILMIHRWNVELESTVSSRTKELAFSETRVRELVETVNDWIWEVDSDGRYVYASSRVMDILGYQPEELLGRTPYNLMPDEEAEKIRGFFQKKVAAKEPFDRLENINRHKNGNLVVIETSGVPVLDDGGNLLGYRGVNRDITERKKAEKKMLASQDRLEAVKNIGAMANTTLDLTEVLEFIMKGTLEVTGASVGMIFLKEQSTGCLSWGASIGLSEAFITEYKKRHIQPGEGLTGRISESGEPIYIHDNYSHDSRIAHSIITHEGLNSFIGVPIYAEGEIIAVMNILTRPPNVLNEQDITLALAVGAHVGSAVSNARLFEERKKAEAKLKASLNEKEILLREIHHRVKNNMQIISSLLRQQSGRMKDKEDMYIFKESQDRINSMALIHEQLYKSDNLMNIDFQEYVRHLVQSLFQSFGVIAASIALKISIEDIFLGVDTAIPCGLVINEIVSNSLKHAFPEGKGEIEISIKKVKTEDEGDDRYRLYIRDNGVGIPEDINIRKTKTLGLQLVTVLIEHQLRGEIELTRLDGTEFNIVFRELKYKKRI